MEIGCDPGALQSFAATVQAALPVGTCGVMSLAAESAHESIDGWTTNDIVVFAGHFDREGEALEQLCSQLGIALKAIATSWSQKDRNLASSVDGE